MTPGDEAPEARGCPLRLDAAAFTADPEAEMRRAADQHWWADGGDLYGRPQSVVVGWEASRRTLTDRRLSPRSFSDAMVASGLSVSTALQVAPLFSLHGDDHRRLRAVLSKAFTPRQGERLRPRTAAIAERLADGIAESDGSVEFVGAFAEPLPPEVFAVLFGLPVTDAGRLGVWAADIAAAFALAMTPEQVQSVESAAAAMRAYAHERIAVARGQPGDDLVSMLAAAEVDGHGLDDDQIVAMITGFVFAGAETTRRQLTAAVQVFAEHPGDWDRLAAEPDLVPGAVEEILRYQPIVPGLTRRAEQPYDDDDLHVDEGDALILSFTTANRDPDRFDDADRFVLDRDDAHAHLTFGWGPHLCVGAGLARLELVEGLRVLTGRFRAPEIERVGPITGLAAPDRLWARFPER